MKKVLRRRTLTPAEIAAIENAEAQAEVNRANIDYVAMMTDVEIPTEEEGTSNEPEI